MVFILPHSAYTSWCQTCKGLFTQSKDLLVMCTANATAKARRPVVDWSLFIKIMKGFTSVEAPNILETSTHWQITSITHLLMVILYHCVKPDPFLSMLMWDFWLNWRYLGIMNYGLLLHSWSRATSGGWGVNNGSNSVFSPRHCHFITSI